MLREVLPARRGEAAGARRKRRIAANLVIVLMVALPVAAGLSRWCCRLSIEAAGAGEPSRAASPLTWLLLLPGFRRAHHLRQAGSTRSSCSSKRTAMVTTLAALVGPRRQSRGCLRRRRGRAGQRPIALGADDRRS
jgi:hypothetical protein